MKYKEINKKAILIDKFIDMNRKSFTLPMKEIDAIIKYLFPSCYIKSKGWFKTVFKICTKKGSKSKLLVLKIGKEKSIENDHTAYKMLPKKIRKKFFAKIYWHTKYCLLQEYGEEVKLTLKDIEKLKLIGIRYGLIDIKKENIREVNGSLKIIDANVFIPGKTKKINLLKDYINIKLS